MVELRTLANLLYKQLQEVQQGRRRRLAFPTTSLEEAYRKVVRKVYLGEFEDPFGGVRGPPGTGKTALAEAATSDAEIVDNLGPIKLIYEAPTNELTTAAFLRLMSLKVTDCDTAKEFLRSVRLYGSLTPRPYISQDLHRLREMCPQITEEDIRQVTEGLVTNDVKYVFATEFQRVSAKVKSRDNFRYFLFIDEASTSPFYLPYTPVSDAALKDLAKGTGRGVLEGLVVVGDEMQAIGLGPEYQGWGVSLLVLPKVLDLLRKIGAEDEQFHHLRETLRMPKPTEEPLHAGFYEEVGGLEAVYHFAEKYKELRLYEWEDRWRKCLTEIDLGVLKDTVETALSSQLPIIVVNVKGSYIPGERVEPRRIKYAIKLAALFRCLYGHLSIAVTGPYRDLVNVSKINYSKRYGRVGAVHFSSVQSMLGKEADIVISILGKEYVSPSGPPTIYFVEPSNLNVQLSRHRSILVVVGDAVRLRNSAAKAAQRHGLLYRSATPTKMIRKTADTLLKLVGTNAKDAKNYRWKEGNAGIFVKI